MLKKAGLIIASITVGLMPIFLSAPAFAAASNLITNASVEAGSNGQPDSWMKGGWGNNTASLTYDTADSHTGTHSLGVNISSYTDGDAKWYFAPIAVTGGQSYVYSDFYKSDVASAVVAQFQDSTGKLSYASLVNPAASSTWQQASKTFTAPTGTVNMTVFHLINSVGSIHIDDASLSQVETPAPTPVPPVTSSNLVPNPSVEIVDSAKPSQPAGWVPGAWGTNNAKFTYLSTGQDGTRSLKVEMTQRTSGDAKWMYAAQAVTPGAVYQFTDYYQSNVATEVDAAITLSDGTVQYIRIGGAVASTSWQQFKGQITMPASAVNVTIMHILYSTGWLITDNFKFAPYTLTGFNRALVSVTFDDAWASIYTNGLPVMKKYGIKSTQYLLTGETSDPSYMTLNMMKAFRDNGHEIASHTVDHPDLTTLSTSAMLKELSQSKQWLQNKLLVSVTDFASPYGSYNANVITGVKKYYASHRGVEEGYNSKDTLDVYDIKVQNIVSTTTVADVAAWVAQAQATKTWLVLVYHQVLNVPSHTSPDDIYWTLTSDLDAQFAKIKQSGVPVVAVNNALLELKPQLGK